jgi:hypothetical protein
MCCCRIGGGACLSSVDVPKARSFACVIIVLFVVVWLFLCAVLVCVAMLLTCAVQMCACMQGDTLEQQQQQLQALQLQPPPLPPQFQQQRQQQAQQQQQQPAAVAMNGGRNISLLNSGELERLLPLEGGNACAGGTGQHPTSSATAAATGGPEGMREQQNSFMQLLEGINSLPMPIDDNVDSLLNPAENPLLNKPMPEQYASQQQQLQQQQQAPGMTRSDGHAAFPAAARPGGPSQQQQQQQQQQFEGFEIPDDYAAFLVDEDDLAAVGSQGAAGQRKRVLSGAGAGMSSCSLDLRQLSDLLMGGSSVQLLEGSTWHKLCRDVSFSRGGRSGPAALGGDREHPGDTVDDAGTVAHGDDEDDLHALLGLRDMSITR